MKYSKILFLSLLLLAYSALAMPRLVESYFAGFLDGSVQARIEEVYRDWNPAQGAQIFNEYIHKSEVLPSSTQKWAKLLEDADSSHNNIDATLEIVELYATAAFPFNECPQDIAFQETLGWLFNAAMADTSKQRYAELLSRLAGLLEGYQKLLGLSQDALTRLLKKLHVQAATLNEDNSLSWLQGHYPTEYPTPLDDDDAHE